MCVCVSLMAGLASSFVCPSPGRDVKEDGYKYVVVVVVVVVSPDPFGRE